MTQQIKRTGTLPAAEVGQRLDQSLARLFPEFSRERLKEWIKSGALVVNGKTAKPTLKVSGGERVDLDAELVPQGQWQAQPVPMEIIYEDSSIAIINKPAGLVVHPAAGNYTGTLLNGLLDRYPDLHNVPRAGVVHRLDKDTTGLMVIAKTLQAQTSLVAQLQARSVAREYLALVHGHPPMSGTVNAAIGRDPHNRKKMAVVATGKDAVTRFQTLQRWPMISLLRLNLGTGRTHQIRVHMNHLGYPLIGDPVYRKRGQIIRGLAAAVMEAVGGLKRQALHAHKLGLLHPDSGEFREWQCDVPADLQMLIDTLNDNPQ